MAILSVVVFHTPADASNGSIVAKLISHVASLGWMGVDLFFVLSGFLITGILIDERTGPHYFRTFYARRILRIVPVYVAFLLFSMWLAPIVHTSSLTNAWKLQELQVWYWLYLVNIYIATHGWAAVATGTTHLWSLCVEEQFYLLWPLAVYVLSSKTLPRVAIGCFVLAELCRIALVIAGAPGEVNYILLPTRMDALSAGAFIACTVRDPGLLGILQRIKRPLAIGSVLALVPPILIEHTLDFQRPLTQLLALPAIAVLSALVVLYASRSARWLGARPLRFFGRYSYGMYIWHVAVIAALAKYTTLLTVRTSTISFVGSYASLLALIVIVTVCTALTSWYLVELPFLKLKAVFPYAR